MQVIHEQDVANAVSKALTCDVCGAFNLAAPEVTSIPELVKFRGRHVFPLPLGWVKKAISLARLLGNRDEFTWIDVLDTNLTVKCEKANRTLGWYPRYSAWQSVEEMISKRPAMASQ